MAIIVLTVCPVCVRAGAQKNLDTGEFTCRLCIRDSKAWRNRIARFLCRIGVHRPMKEICYSFTDVVVKKGVYEWRCSCGREYLAKRSDILWRIETLTSLRKRGIERGKT